MLLLIILCKELSVRPGVVVKMETRKELLRKEFFDILEINMIIKLSNPGCLLIIGDRRFFSNKLLCLGVISHWQSNFFLKLSNDLKSHQCGIETILKQGKMKRKLILKSHQCGIET